MQCDITLEPAAKTLLGFVTRQLLKLARASLHLRLGTKELVHDFAGVLDRLLRRGLLSGWGLLSSYQWPRLWLPLQAGLSLGFRTLRMGSFCFGCSSASS